MVFEYKRVLDSYPMRGLLINTLQQGPIPHHIAFIMDGNRRYAKLHRMSIGKGHYLGSQALIGVGGRAIFSINQIADYIKIVESCFQLGVDNITAYAFSIENFHRPNEQVQQIMMLFEIIILLYCRPGEFADRNRVAVRLFGRLDLLDDDLRNTVCKAARRTHCHKERTLNLCIAYTSREEITSAVKSTVEQCLHEGLTPADITTQSLTDHMYIPESPPVDLMVRTSSVSRLSDFLLWQCHQNTDIEILDPLWPDIGMKDLVTVILRWQRRMHHRNRGFQPDYVPMKSALGGFTVCFFLVASICGYSAMFILSG